MKELQIKTSEYMTSFIVIRKEKAKPNIVNQNFSQERN